VFVPQGSQVLGVGAAKINKRNLHSFESKLDDINI